MEYDNLRSGRGELVLTEVELCARDIEDLVAVDVLHLSESGLEGSHARVVLRAPQTGRRQLAPHGEDPRGCRCLHRGYQDARGCLGRGQVIRWLMWTGARNAVENPNKSSFTLESFTTCRLKFKGAGQLVCPCVWGCFQVRGQRGTRPT